PLTHDLRVTAVAFAPGGKVVVSAAGLGQLRLWDAESGKEIAALDGHAEVMTGLAFSRDGKLLLTCGVDKTLRVWDWQAGKPTLRHQLKHDQALRCLTVHPDNRRVAVADKGGTTIYLWDVAAE